jgi:hypothetical protein
MDFGGDPGDVELEGVVEKGERTLASEPQAIHGKEGPYDSHLFESFLLLEQIFTITAINS